MPAPMRNATASPPTRSTTRNAAAAARRGLDDFGVARISSFLKSYGEMRRGEQFVMDEVRARARERVRWVVSAGLLALALIAAPLSWRRLWLRRRDAPADTASSETVERRSET